MDRADHAPLPREGPAARFASASERGPSCGGHARRAGRSSPGCPRATRSSRTGGGLDWAWSSRRNGRRRAGPKAWPFATASATTAGGDEPSPGRSAGRTASASGPRGRSSAAWWTTPRTAQSAAAPGRDPLLAPAEVDAGEGPGGVKPSIGRSPLRPRRGPRPEPSGYEDAPPGPLLPKRSWQTSATAACCGGGGDRNREDPAYMLPAVELGRRVVVSTGTRTCRSSCASRTFPAGEGLGATSTSRYEGRETTSACSPSDPSPRRPLRRLERFHLPRRGGMGAPDPDGGPWRDTRLPTRWTSGTRSPPPARTASASPAPTSTPLGTACGSGPWRRPGGREPHLLCADLAVRDGTTAR